jgi:ubiquinone biosynthesis protein Coq4
MQLLVMLTHNVALPVLKIFRRTKPFPYTFDQIGSFPPGTLGKDLHDFLATKKLQLLSHYTRHDLKHIVLNYDTTEKGEACLQSFMLGNGRVSFPVLATVIYAFVTMPEYWSDMKDAYKKGNACPSIHGWEWNKLLKEETEKLRTIIFKK